MWAVSEEIQQKVTAFCTGVWMQLCGKMPAAGLLMFTLQTKLMMGSASDFKNILKLF